MKPQQITRLSGTVYMSDPTSIVLNWQAPADFYGNAVAGYDIRFSMNPITESNWELATPAGARGVYPNPGTPGYTEKFTLSYLKSRTRYYIGIKSLDSRSNESTLSNIDSVSTR